LNAGVCSGSLAQGLLLARELVPEIEPDCVLLQDSPWLIDRARSEYAPTFLGKIPTPVFVTAASGIEISRPPFETMAFDLPTAEFRYSPRGLGDFASFLSRLALPLLVHDDWCVGKAELRGVFRARRPPAPFAQI